MRTHNRVALSDRLVTLGFAGVIGVMLVLTAAQAASPYAAWSNGPSTDPDYFPIGVWLQAPSNAARYKAIGINLYVGLWNGLDTTQLNQLKQNGMQVICNQNAYALSHLSDGTLNGTVVGWQQQDEPDNAQNGTQDPVSTTTVIANYSAMRAHDPTRPIYLNLGQGVAWDGWWGRGNRTNHPEDYAQYAKGSDIASFDEYPVDNNVIDPAGTPPWFSHAAVNGERLWYVARGVQRLRGWVNDAKPVWNDIECTRINNPADKPTPQQTKAEVWMSIVHSSRGIVYFCHQFVPSFDETGLLDDPAMSAAVGDVNRQIQSLAAVINSPTVTTNVAQVTASPATVDPLMTSLMPGEKGIALMEKQYQGAIYLFTVRMDNASANGTFQVPGLSGDRAVQVLGENRTLTMRNGEFQDSFDANGVHIYQIQGVPEPGTFVLAATGLAGLLAYAWHKRNGERPRSSLPLRFSR
jgi:hypothetical protein